MEERLRALGDVYRCKLEVLDEEAGGLQATARSIHAMASCDVGSRPIGVTDQTLIDDIEATRLAITAVNQRFDAITRANVLATEDLAKLATRCSAAATAEVLAMLCDCDLKVWDGRIDAARRNLSAMRSAAASEADEIADAIKSEAAARVATVLAPAIPTLPGAGSSGKTSLGRLRGKLAQALAEATAGHSTSNLLLQPQAASAGAPTTPADASEVASPATRRQELTAKQVALQLECRCLEAKDFENHDEPPATSSSSCSFAATESDDSIGVRHSDAVARSRAMRSPKLSETPASVLTAETRSLCSRFDREIQSMNAVEAYNGYIKQTQRHLSCLKQAAGLDFTVVPGGSYELGQADDRFLSTLLTVAGSVDHEARLDRRTMHWLLSPAASKTHGIHYRDGPQHFMYATCSRVAHLSGFYLTRRPITASQFRALCADRKFHSALVGVVPDALLSPSFREHYSPKYSVRSRDMCGYSATSLKRATTELHGSDPTPPDSGNADDNDDSLEVPYFAAEAIAAALGGVVCPVDVWEAAGMGPAGRRSHLLTASDVDSLDVYQQPWKVVVDGGERREVGGTSWKIGQKGRRLLLRQRTQLGFELFNRVGCEWNSLLDVRQKRPPPPAVGDELGEQDRHYALPKNCAVVPTTHVLRSLSDLGTQHIVLGEALVPKKKKKSSPTPDDSDWVPSTEHNSGNADSFSGPALYTIGLPNWTTPVAAFRVAIPIFCSGRQRVDEETERIAALGGRNITFADAVTCLGREEDAIACLQAVSLADVRYDAYYGTKEILLPSAGVDFTLSECIPRQLVAVTFHGTHPLQDLTSAPERRSFSHPIGTDAIIPVMLPIAGEELAACSKALRESSSCRVRVDNLLELTYEDTLMLPPIVVGERTIAKSLRLAVTWCFSTVLTNRGSPLTIVPKVIVRLATSQ
jgi:hypothetical protein